MKVQTQKKILIVIISLLCFNLASCSKKIDKDNSVALIDNQVITKKLYEKELSYYQKFYIKKYGENFLDTDSKKGNANYKKLEKKLLDSLIQDQVMLNDLKKNKIKISKNDSLEIIDDLSKKSITKDSLLENVKSFGASQDEFDEITFRDSIRKKHKEYFYNNNNIKDSEILDFFKENESLQKKYKYDCLIFDDESEAIKVRSNINNSQMFRKYLNSKIRNFDVYRSDFVYDDNQILKLSSVKKTDQISKVFKYKDSYVILMVNSINNNKRDLLFDAKKIYLENEYEKYLKKLIKNSNIKLFI